MYSNIHSQRISYYHNHSKDSKKFKISHSIHLKLLKNKFM